MFKLISTLISIAWLLVSHVAWADDVCAITAMRDVASIDDPTTMMRAGDHQNSITGYQVDRGNRVASFCQHGGYCWPENVTISGRSVPAVKLTNCSIDRQHVRADGDTVAYELLPLRGKIGQRVMKESDVADQFMRMGMCHACAQNVAGFYVHKPTTECGRLAKSALEGNPNALAILNEEKPGPKCQYWQ